MHQFHEQIRVLTNAAVKANFAVMHQCIKSR